MKKNYIVTKTTIVSLPSITLLLGGSSGETQTTNGFTFEVSETEYSGGDVEVEQLYL